MENKMEISIERKEKSPALELLPIQNEVPNCFVCGQDNPKGLKLRFTKQTETSLNAELTPPDYWTGWGQMMHGGFHGLLLDEIMSWVAYGLMNVKAFVTKEMTVKYIRPVYVGQPLKVIGYLEEDTDNGIRVRGEIRDAEANVLTVANGILVRISPEKMKKMLG